MQKKIETTEEIFKRLKEVRNESKLVREFKKWHKLRGEDNIDGRVLIDIGAMNLYRIGMVEIKGEEIILQQEMNYHG